MNRRKWITHFLVTMLVIAVATACASNKANKASNEATPSTSASQTPGQSASSPTEASPYENKVTLTYLNNKIDATKWKDGTYVETVLEPRFNVELKGAAINSLDENKVKTFLAGGDVPDVIIGYNGQQYYDDGILRSIPMELVEQYMPNTVNIINKLTPEYAWSISRSYTDGQLFMIPSIALAGAAKGSIIVRKDWMDATGITKPPETLDELHEMLKRFTFDDPDKNGKNDTYGIDAILELGIERTLNTVQGAFGINVNAWTEQNGKIVFGGVTEEYKEFLKLASSWFKEGIIDPSITDTRTQKDAKMLNGKLGAHTTNIQYLFTQGYVDPSALLKQQGVDYVVLPATKGPQGKSGAFTYSPYFGWGMMFGAKTTDEQMIRAMQIADSALADEDLLKTMLFGQEGVHYDMTPDGRALNKEGVDLGENAIALFFNHVQVTRPVATLLSGKDAVDAMIENAETVPYSGNIIDAGALQAKHKNNLKVQVGEMNKLVEEFFTDGLTGKIDIDKEWDSYVKKWNDMGGATLTEDAQSAPKLNTDWKIE